MADLEMMLHNAKEEIKACSSQNELNEKKAYYLGKKSPLNDIMKQMATLSIEEKKELGQKVNAFKTKIEELIQERRKEIEQELINEKLKSETIDVTMPGKVFNTGSIHPLNKVINELNSIFLGMGYNVAEGPEVEIDKYNFEMLNVPVGHPARDMQDSFYITEDTLLRTQTSSVQVRTLLEAKGKPIKSVCPGRVYRRDDDDATHSHQFMQIEGLVVDENITLSDLKGTLQMVVEKMFGSDRKIRFRPSFFPFTEPSVEVDVSCVKCGGKGCPICKKSGWIEILGAGMVHPNVLEMAGYDSTKMRGFAFGIGVERVTMLRYGIDDIRNFYTDDVRFLNQFKKGE